MREYNKPISIDRLRQYRKYSPLLVVIPLCLSAYTFLWNPIEFPNIHADEGTYMLRALTFLKDKTLLPQGAPFYDHPFFGQVFLASVMALFGYPDSLNPSADGDVSSIQSLFLFPRILMGLLAVVDTLLVYKITERRYGKTVALIAAVLFAVMPITWILRRILLDNLLLPFLLSSILCTTYMKSENREHKKNRRTLDKKCFGMVILSGAFLGLAIFTKMPAFTFIPLVSFLVFANGNRNWKILGLWFIPVILIPAVWPMSAYSVGQFDNWFDGIVHQATERASKPLIDSLMTFFQVDPILLVIGISGIIFACLRKDLYILLSIVPYLIFLQLVEFVSVYHLVLLLPPICIASSELIHQSSVKLRNKKLSIVPYAVVSAIFIFGLLMSTLLINTTFNSSYFKTYAAFVKQLPEAIGNGNNTGSGEETLPIVVGRYWTKSFLWAAQYAFDKEFTLIREDSRLLNEINQKNINSTSPPIILIVDNNMKRNMQTDTVDEKYDILRSLRDVTHTTQQIEENRLPHDRSKYPYSGLYDNRRLGNIELRSN